MRPTRIREIKMKKTLLVVSALSVALASQAQILKPKSVLGDMKVPVSVPGMFTCDGKSRMSNYLDYNEKNVKVYNEDLEVEKEFDLVLPNEQSYAVTKYRELLWKNMPQFDKVVDYADDPIAIEKVTVDLIRDMTELNEYYEPRKIFGKEAVITETSRTATSVSFDISVNKDSLEVSKDYNGKLTGHYYIGKITYTLGDTLVSSGDRVPCGKYSGTLKYYGPSLTGAWKEDPEKSDERSFEIRPINLYYYDMASLYDDDYFLITQNLFNADKAYEYVVPICQLSVERTVETDLDGDGEVDQITTWYGCDYPGFKIMQDNGNVVATIMFDEGYRFNSYSLGMDQALSLVHFENKDYIVTNVEKTESDGKTESASIFYAITPGDAASIKAVRTERTGLKATPEFARKNEMVVVDFSTIENAKLLSVVNGNGQTVMQTPVANGQTSYRLNTSNLPAGLYVVKVDNGKRMTESCKIVVR